MCDFWRTFVSRVQRRIDRVTGRAVVVGIKLDNIHFGLNTTEVRKRRIIVSMASYRLRYETIGLVLESLLRQSVKPDKILVYLDDENEENKITDLMHMYSEYGVEYVYTGDGLRSHKKYYYAMKDYPDDIIITVDDDLIYSKDLIESLIKMWEKYPDCVCARRVHKINVYSDGRVTEYNKWGYECREMRRPSHLLCATTGAGCLFPPNILPEAAFNKADIRETSLSADDMWLKTMLLLNETKVIWVPSYYVMPKGVRDSSLDALSKKNVFEGGNDRCLAILQKRYPYAFKVLVEDWINTEK